jgi:acyl carrier protein
MIPNQEIFEKLRPLIWDCINFTDPNTVKPEANFSKDLRATETDIEELVMMVQTHFDIVIPDEDIANLLNGTVQDAVNYVAAKVEEAQ